MVFQKVLSRLKKIFSVPMLILTAAGVLNFYYVLHFSVNAPHREEWEYLFVFSPEGSVFHVNQTARPVFAYSIAYIFFLLNGWDISFHLLFNYFVYLADIVLLYRLIIKTAGNNYFLPFFFLPFFSDLNALNLMQASALQLHLCVLFGLIAAEIGFCRPSTYHNSLKLILFATLSVLSMNLVFIFGILLGWGIMELGRKNWPRILGTAFFTIAIFHLCNSSISFFSGEKLFYQAVLLYSAVLTGFDTQTPLHMIFILPVIAGLGYIFYKDRAWKNCHLMFLFSIVSATFFSALNAESSTDPYTFMHKGAGMALFAVPVVFTLLRKVKAVFIYVCCLSVIGYSASFSPDYFKAEASSRLQTLSCAQEYRQGLKNKECLFYSDDVPDLLKLAQELQLNFIRE